MEQFVKRAQVGIDAWFKGTLGVQATGKLIHHACENLTYLLAETKPVKPVTAIYGAEYTTERSMWHDKWWTRLIRWMLGKKWLNMLVPYPIECLALAHYVSAQPTTRYLSKDPLMSIREQQIALMMHKMTPGAILVGHRAMSELARTLNFDIMPPLMKPRSSGPAGTLDGLPVFLHPCMGDETMIVAPKAEECWRSDVAREPAMPETAEFDEGRFAAAAWNKLMGREPL